MRVELSNLKSESDETTHLQTHEGENRWAFIYGGLESIEGNGFQTRKDVP